MIIVFAEPVPVFGGITFTTRECRFAFAGFLIKLHLDEEKVNPRWIKYYCQSQQYNNWIQSFNAGSTRGNINAKTYETCPSHSLIGNTNSAVYFIR